MICKIGRRDFILIINISTLYGEPKHALQLFIIVFLFFVSLFVYLLDCFLGFFCVCAFEICTAEYICQSFTSNCNSVCASCSRTEDDVNVTLATGSEGQFIADVFTLPVGSNVNEHSMSSGTVSGVLSERMNE